MLIGSRIFLTIFMEVLLMNGLQFTAPKINELRGIE